MAQINTYLGGTIVTNEDLLHWKYLRKYESKTGKMIHVYPNRLHSRKKRVSNLSVHVEKKEVEHNDICSDELYHHGILGQKWGIRRYQNPDGTLTAEGRIRYRDDGTKRPASERRVLQKEYDAQKKAKAKQEAADILEKQKSKKKISEMSDEELQQYISRKANEARALQLDTEIARLSPKSISKGEEFTKKLINDVLIPAGSQGLKNFVNKTIDNYMKDTDDPEYKRKKESERLVQESKDWQNKANIQFNKNRLKEEERKAKQLEEEDK